MKNQICCVAFAHAGRPALSFVILSSDGAPRSAARFRYITEGLDENVLSLKQPSFCGKEIGRAPSPPGHLVRTRRAAQQRQAPTLVQARMPYKLILLLSRRRTLF